jgi:hypothetical protein
LPKVPKLPPDSSSASARGAAENSLGRPNFAALIGQDSPERQDILARVLATIDEEKLEVIRIAFVDTHGIVRTRPIEARLFSQAARNGVPFTTAFFAMDSANIIFQNVFAKDGGFAAIPWVAPGTCWPCRTSPLSESCLGRTNAAGS